MVSLLAVLGFPLLGAVLMFFFGRRLGRGPVHAICVGSIALSFLASAAAVLSTGGHAQLTLGPWLPWMNANWGFLLDELSSLMILLVTGVALLVHIYSTGYMRDEAGFARFFGFLNLFVFFMLLLVLADNYPLLFIGWEGVGLCSYFLIGFDFHRKAATDAGNKAFLVNRVGDVCFLLGIFWMWTTLGTISFAGISETLAGRSPELAFGTLSAIALLLAIGASGKSAQLPLYVWLPDAMEGPTPVSALIHAATMVTAGIYVIARSSALYSLTPQVSTILLVAGALTAFIAATIACVQNDIKRVLAYSTVSQLGFMTMALGAGAYWVAMFHLFTHAFFKALLFLGAGNVLHATHEQDMRRIGGLRTAMPWTFRLMTIGTLAIAGLPPLAGFFSKDEILIALWASPQSSTLIFAIALFTAALTAYYMFRMMRLTFFGMPQSETHAHEASRAMLLPLGILAIGSIVTGWPYARFHHWIAPALRDRYSEPHNLTTALTFAAVSTMAVIVGFALSRFEVPEPLAAVFRRGWFIHDLYNVVFVRGLALTGGRVLNAIDRAVVDGGVNGTALLTRAFSSFLSLWDRYVVDGIVRAISTIVTLSSYPIRLLQTGSVQTYALAVAVAIFAMISLYLTRL